ncbi:MAG: ParB/RepB/Spo0J family partition protein [Alphaproteobacteria bacterium]|nr:ParB/RepB/Spo0J family partition protein [Alphaproteobacteria bacterium]
MRKIRYKQASADLINLAAPDESKKLRVSIGMDNFVKEYYLIDIKKIIPYKNQSRKIFNEEEIKQLAETIKEHGVLQPLSVIESDAEGFFEVLSGERRLRAAKVAELQKVPCIIINDKNNCNEKALIENLQRANLNPIELANGLKVIVENNKNLRQTDLARRLGLKDSFISETLKLLELPEEIQERILNEDIRNRDLLRDLFKAKEIDNQKQILDQHVIKKRKLPLNKNNSYRSILRLSYKDGELKIQKSFLEKLLVDERQKVKEALLEIIKSL